MQTNILALPLAQLTIETGNNEDWIDYIAYVVADGTQVDIRGIRFEMEIRRNATAHEVVLNGSTDDGSLMVGNPPDYGVLIIEIDVDRMRLQSPGVYVGDIVGVAEGYTRACLKIDLTVFEGLTR